MSSFAVITSINAPTGAVAEWARTPWRVVVVADNKTPADWSLSNVQLIRVEDQTDAFARLLPVNHYSRKMLGYAHAIRAGATIILDTDDDNYPDPGFHPELPIYPHAELSCVHGWINLHAAYGHADSWPRGFPLRLINAPQHITRSHNPSSVYNVGIWQGLVNTEPDIDAIHRLTRADRPVFPAAGVHAVRHGRATPFNSQNTVFLQPLFPLLYLPCTVTFRFTDILRSIVAQPIMWSSGYSLGVTGANAMQRRNEHDLMADFKSEIPVYTQVEEALEAVKRAVIVGGDIRPNMIRAYAELERIGIVQSGERAILEAWLEAITP